MTASTAQSETETPEQNTAPAEQKPEGDKSAEDARTTDEKLAELTAKFESLQTNSRKWETRAKENKDAAAELAQIKAQGMTPDQKLQAAEDKASKAERDLAKYKVAAETGLPADLLVGDDEDSIRDFAKKLAEFKGVTPKTAPPKPDPSQGGTGGKSKPTAADEGRAEAARRFKKS
ncbi:hypothetical protein [Amycolatopsis sp. PS_44_ISF1]|uniref:hypothetical protein n=1 Tax=Amycolatopsis sp. PS_44_ISF1 TaxID=2974917 RepID=UPI0028DDB854|nr:hypothetical protein [Amycolatopsis sp. PS_44_ISF1]MDT8915751.1 hypothetical protein [Amycolatopsis sp. PS_44_ISF1]